MCEISSWPIGGSISNIYEYDSLYRLKHSSGTSVVTNGTYEFDLDMIYYLSGKIRTKDQSATLGGNSIPQLTYFSAYDYQGTQPHAPSTIGNEDLIYDNNGNILRSINTGTGAKRYHSWDEENRMKLVTDQQNMGYYLYDGGGERTLKIIGKYSSMSISGEPAWNGYLSNKQTLYVNPYLVVNNKEYTKHYYIENQRIVSKLGGGFIMDTVPLFHMMFGFNVLDPHDYNIKKHEDEAMVKRDLMGCGQPGTLQITTGLYNFLSHQPTRNDIEENIYYYHGDHLGSTSYITDVTGMPSQHIDYLPFGEPLLEEKTQTWQSPYKFNCKELDEESGLYYYGARYYDPQKSVFLGIDPMSDKHPDYSPYHYCFNNPIKLIDPMGMDTSFSNAQDRAFVLDVINQKSPNYNKEFAGKFQKLVDSKKMYKFSSYKYGDKKDSNGNNVPGVTSQDNSNSNQINIEFTKGDDEFTRDPNMGRSGLGVLFEETYHAWDYETGGLDLNNPTCTSEANAWKFAATANGTQDNAFGFLNGSLYRDVTVMSRIKNATVSQVAQWFKYGMPQTRNPHTGTIDRAVNQRGQSMSNPNIGLYGSLPLR